MAADIYDVYKIAVDIGRSRNRRNFSETIFSAILDSKSTNIIFKIIKLTFNMGNSVKGNSTPLS